MKYLLTYAALETALFLVKVIVASFLFGAFAPFGASVFTATALTMALS